MEFTAYGHESGIYSWGEEILDAEVRSICSLNCKMSIADLSFTAPLEDVPGQIVIISNGFES